MERFKKYLPYSFAMFLGMLMVPRLAFADGTTISSSSFSGVISAITAQINVTSIAEVLTYAAGIAVTLVFFWWGVRKALNIIMPAGRRGRMRL